MSYRADKLRVDAHARTHTQTDAGNDNTRRPKLASVKTLLLTGIVRQIVFVENDIV